MGAMTHTTAYLDDFVAGFASDTLPIRGRAIKLGRGSLSPILDRHDYPDHLATILGEAVMLAALFGSAMKFQGRILVQAEGDGPVSMLVGEYRKDGGLRAYARYDKELKINEPHDVDCPFCGSSMRKIYSSVPAHFKGSGFYSTDK